MNHDDACRAQDGAPVRLRGMAFWLLRRASLDAERLTRERLLDAGMRRGFYGVLAALVEFGPAAQADLGRRLGVDRSDMVAIVNDLESEGYVSREPDPTDRRRNSVVVTRSGRGALTRFDRAIAEAEKSILDSLTVEERAALVGLLQRVVQSNTHSG